MEEVIRIKRSLGAKNKAKGSHAERYYANVFKDLGYKHCVTARLGSRISDNAGIDIINIPFNIQVKSGKQNKMSPGKVLLNMQAQIQSLFPEDNPVQKYPILVIHRPQPFKKDYLQDVVYMSMNQFNIFTEKYGKIEYLFIKKRVYKTTSEFGDIIAVSFNTLVTIGVFKKC